MSVDFGFCYPEAFQQTQDGLDRTYSGMAELHAKRVRILIPWSQTQISRGNYNFAVTDAAVYSAVAHGLKPLLVYAPFPFPPSPWTPEDFGAWVSAFAKHYADVADEHELWNEPNAFGFWPGSVDPASYTSYLRAGYNQIKAVQPNSTVLSAGLNPCGNGWLFLTLSMDPVEYLNGIYAAGGGPYFDAVANHPYSVATSAGGTSAEMPSVTERYIARDQDLYNLMVSKGDGAKKVWHTEWGFPSSVVGLQNQRDWLQIQFDIMRARPQVGPIFFYAFHDLTADTSASESTFGCVDFNYNRKPSYAFYESLNPGQSAVGSRSVTALAVGSGTINVPNTVRANITGSSVVQSNKAGISLVSVLAAGSGGIVSQRNYSYTFVGSTKPTALFTSFGEGYYVSGGVASPNAAASDGYKLAGAIYNQPVLSANHAVQFTTGPGSASGDRSNMPIVRSDASGANWVGAFGKYGGAGSSQIVSCVGGVLTARASSEANYASGDVMRLVADGNAYRLFKNGGLVTEWVDRNNEFAGATNKFTGFGFYFIRQFGTNYGPPGVAGTWSAADLRAVVTPPGGPLVVSAGAAGSGTTSGVVGTSSASVSAAGVGTGVKGCVTGGVLAVSASGTGSGNNGQVNSAGAVSVAAAAVGQAVVSITADGSLNVTATDVGAGTKAAFGTGSLTVTNSTFGDGLGYDVVVEYVSTGTGGSTTDQPGVTWTHDILASDSETVVIVAFGGIYPSTAGIAHPVTATFGGIAMAHIFSEYPATGSFNTVAFYLVNPPVGTSTVTCVAEGLSPGTIRQGNSFLYNGFGGINGLTGSAGTTANRTVTVTSTPKSRVLALNMGATFAATSTSGVALYKNTRLMVHDADGAASVLMSSTSAAGSRAVVGLSVNPPIPPPPQPMGNGNLTTDTPTQGQGTVGAVADATTLITTTTLGAGTMAATAQKATTITAAGAGAGGVIGNNTATGTLATTATASGAAMVRRNASGTNTTTANPLGTGAVGTTAGGTLTTTATTASTGQAGTVADGTHTTTITATGAATVTAAAVPPTFQAAGNNGGSAGFNTSVGTTINITAGTATGRYALVGISYRHGGQSYASQTTTATYNGTAMTKLFGVGHSSDCSIEIWGIANPTATAANVVVTCSGPGNTGREVAANVAIFNGVTSLNATMVNNTGSGNTITCPVAPTTSELPVLIFGQNTNASLGAGTGMTLRSARGSGSSFASNAIVTAPNTATSMLGTSSMNGAWVAETLRLIGT